MTAKKKAAAEPAERAAKREPLEGPAASERIDRFIADLDDWRGELIAEIRRLIHEVDPDVVEGWKWMGSPTWSHDGMYAVVNPHRGKVKLTFLHGAHLADHGRIFNAGLDGNKWRAIDFYEGGRIDMNALKRLLREAVAWNSAHAKA